MSIAVAPARAALDRFPVRCQSGQTDKPASSSERRIWRIGEFTAIQRAEREAGGRTSSQPPSRRRPLRQLLAPVRLVVSKNNVALFHPRS